MSRPSTFAGDEVYHSVANTPTPSNPDMRLERPLPNFAMPDSSASTPRGSYHPTSITPSNSAPLLVDQGDSDGGHQPNDGFVSTGEKGGIIGPTSRRAATKRKLLLTVAIVTLLAIFLAVFLPVYFTVIKPNQKNSTGKVAGGVGGGTGSPTSSKGAPQPTKTNGPKNAISGGDGSTVTTSDGTTFIYSNPFGGFWVSDPANPFNNDARPNSWTPPLNTSWDFSKDKIYGVNLGGWFVLEPFIRPDLFQKYPGAVDEWTLSEAMAADTGPGGGISQIENHYNTFITEEDFAQIAGAGLNWVRIPIPFWAIDAWAGEPFLVGTSWKYILRALEWARKYGLRVKLDLHTCPGSQNGFNHSGKDGSINFLNGVMGLANGERMMNYIRTITEFISQPQYSSLVTMFGVINEPELSNIGQDPLSRYYYQAYKTVRDITGIGAGNGPPISLHDGFGGTGRWAGFLEGSDRVFLDTHPYFAFNGQPNTQPIPDFTDTVCNSWAVSMATSQTAFGFTFAGEFSTAINDCGLFVNGVGNTHDYPLDCTQWTDYQSFSPQTVSDLKDFISAQMEGLGNWFFWTWKIHNSSTSGLVEAPFWSYQLGLQQGWIPSDPRSAIGTCAKVGAPFASFDGAYSDWQTGGPGAGTISAAALATVSAYPPPTLSNVNNVLLLPTYTSTAPASTLPPPTFTGAAAKVDPGDGWFDQNDTGGAPTTVAGCPYPNAWDAETAPEPVVLCPNVGGVVPTPAVPVPAVDPDTTTTSTSATLTTAPLEPARR